MSLRLYTTPPEISAGAPSELSITLSGGHGHRLLGACCDVGNPSLIAAKIFLRIEELQTTAVLYFVDTAAAMFLAASDGQAFFEPRIERYESPSTSVALYAHLPLPGYHFVQPIRVIVAIDGGGVGTAVRNLKVWTDYLK